MKSAQAPDRLAHHHCHRQTPPTAELASMPGLPKDRIKAILTFVVVGGGPTGVEFAGTLSDFLKGDLAQRRATPLT